MLLTFLFYGYRKLMRMTLMERKMMKRYIFSPFYHIIMASHIPILLMLSQMPKKFKFHFLFPCFILVLLIMLIFLNQIRENAEYRFFKFIF